jgi:tRNA (adenine22-N1)-methyltransferase
MSRLGERLAALAAHIPAGSRAADIGTDHAYLPIALLRRGLCPCAILTDINEGPLSKARENILRAYQDAGENAVSCRRGSIATPDGVYTLRCGDGLVPIEHGEADVAVIAGMGGETILHILNADPEKTRSIGIYVLQPRTKPAVLRQYIYDNNYYVIDEDLAEENGRICEIIVMSPGRPNAQTSGNRSDASHRIVLPEAEQIRMLKAKQHVLLGRFIEAKIAAEQRIADEAAKGVGAAAMRRVQLAAERIDALSRLAND